MTGCESTCPLNRIGKEDCQFKLVNILCKLKYFHEDETDDSIHRYTKIYKYQQRVNRCTTKLFDERLLAKVSSGNIVAGKAKFRSQCLAALYNAAARTKLLEFDEDRCGRINRYVLCMSSIEETLEEHTPVVKLPDLAWLHIERLVIHSVPSPY